MPWSRILSSTKKRPMVQCPMDAIEVVHQASRAALAGHSETGVMQELMAYFPEEAREVLAFLVHKGFRKARWREEQMPGLLNYRAKQIEAATRSQEVGMAAEFEQLMENHQRLMSHFT